MRALSARDIVGVWELSEHQTPMGKALTILEAAYPELSRRELALLSIGQRDLRLLLLRRQMLGPRLESLAECPKCHEPLEFTLDVSDIVVGTLSDEREEYSITVGEFTILFRLVDSTDLAAIARCASVSEARALLVRRCVLECRRGDEEIASGELPEEIVEELAEQVARHDPQAEVLFNLVCPVCKHAWQVFFDIVTYFPDELRSSAVRLLRDVHYLARAYGWREDEILSMSATKRQLYLEMIS